MSDRSDAEKTAAFELGHGDDAVLLVHGFTGSPWEVRPLGEALAERGYYVRGIRLPGHGGAPEAMEQVSFRDWEQAVEDALVALAGYRRLFVAGLSMGALLALQAAARYPRNVTALALLAPAMRFRDLRLRAMRYLRFLPVEAARPWVAKLSTDLQDPGERAHAPMMTRFPLARVRDFWEVRQRARDLLGQVQAPTLVAMATHDHVVTLDGGRELARRLTRAARVQLVEVCAGFHLMSRDRGRAAVAEVVARFFAQESA